MGGGDLNLKKSWHPGTLKNIETLKKELEEERAAQELQQLHEQSGKIKKKVQRVEWLYAAPAGSSSTVLPEDREAFLLGKKRIDKLIESGSTAEELSSKSSFNPTDAIIYGANANSARDIANKIREDPLFAIKQREHASLKAIMDNPLRKKAIVQAKETEKERKKREKKEEKKRRKEEKKRAKGKEAKANDQSDDDSDSDRNENRSADRSRKRSRSPEGQIGGQKRRRSLDNERNRYLVSPESDPSYRAGGGGRDRDEGRSRDGGRRDMEDDIRNIGRRREDDDQPRHRRTEGHGMSRRDADYQDNAQRQRDQDRQRPSSRDRWARRSRSRTPPRRNRSRSRTPPQRPVRRRRTPSGSRTPPRQADNRHQHQQQQRDGVRGLASSSERKGSDEQSAAAEAEARRREERLAAMTAGARDAEVERKARLEADRRKEEEEAARERAAERRGGGDLFGGRAGGAGGDGFARGRADMEGLRASDMIQRNRAFAHRMDEGSGFMSRR
ncbi:Pre-mRNA splicing factor-domain-containing protein [Zopfochytrium polystomum]|nr:Pre-mRNA splicing factor-domain-containing protein [Zopfochytrium polystomum]